MIRLSVAVQHHPERAPLLEALLASLRGVDVEVVTDPEPDGMRSAWRTYRKALDDTPERATHRLVLQDDATVCPDFAQVVERAITARPMRLLALCVCGNAVATTRRIYTAAQQGLSWAVLDSAHWVPAIAVVWPVHLIQPALAYIDEQHWPPEFNADDEILGRAVRNLGEYVLCTVPSIVEHDDMQPSAAGKRAMYGGDPGRVTSCPPAPGCDLLAIDWTLGPE